MEASMTQTAEIMATLEASFRDRSVETQSIKGERKKNRSYRCQWKSDELKVRVELFHEDSNRMLLNSLLVEKNIRQWREDFLEQTVTAILNRLTYLQGSFQMIELDETNQALLLRSADPELRTGEISYFEIIFKHGAWFGQRNHLTLKRYESRRNSKEPRAQAPFTLSKPQMERLLDDLIGIL
jgi:hypothetical protein